MKIRADRAELADSITWVAQVIPKKATQSALTGIKLSTSVRGLSIYAFDYDTSHDATVEVEVLAEGECLVSGSFLRDVVGAMKGKSVELVLEGEHLTVTSGRSTYRAPTLNLADYPTLPGFPKVAGDVSADGLQLLVNTVTHASDPGNAVEEIRGVRFEGTPDGLTMVGTDRFTLAAAEVDWHGGDFQATVPGRMALASIKGLQGAVEIGYTDGHIGFRDPERSVTMRCFATDFIKWRAAIRPLSKDEFVAEVDTQELLDAVKRAGRLVRDERAISLTTSEGAIEIRVDADEDGAGSEVIDADCVGEITVRMGARRFAESLVAADSKRLTLHFKGELGSVLLRPLDHPRTAIAVQPRRKL